MPVRIEELLRHRAWVSALARSLVGDDHTADDLVQDTYATALTRPPADRRSLRGWLATVLRNRLRDRQRVESRRAGREERAARGEATPSAADLAATADAHRRVMDAVVALDEPYREAVLLRYYEGLDVTAVAKRQGVPPSTARSRLLRARDRLRERLDDTYGGDGRAWSLALVPFLTMKTPPAPQAATGGLGEFLMAHRVLIVGLGLMALVMVSVIVSAGSPSVSVPPPAADDTPFLAGDPAPMPVPGDERAKGSAAAKAEAAAFRLPGTSRADAVPLPIEGTTTIVIGRDGQATLGDFTTTLGGPRRSPWSEGTKRLFTQLLRFAEEKRDTGHPMQPSLQGVLLRADALTPWRVVRQAMALPGDPDVRMYRIYWAGRRGDTDVGLPVFLAKDRGLAMTKLRVVGRLPARVFLRRDAGGTKVSLLDRDLGTNEAGMASLATELPALLEAAAEVRVMVHAEDDVPLEHVIRALDLVPKPYAGNLADFSMGGPHYPLSGAPTGPVEGTVEEMERRFVPKEKDRDRVRELVTEQQLSPAEFRELAKKTVPSRALALGLARAYLARGAAGDNLRVVCLSGLVSSGDPAKRYDRTWWEAETLILRAYHAYAVSKEDLRAAEEGLGRCRALANLGLLDRSPLRSETIRIRGDLEAFAKAAKSR